MKIKSIRKIDSKSKCYDLQTEKTHNFFANNVLVHNSLLTLYFYKGKWEVATTGTPDGAGQIGNWGMSFSDLFFQTWIASGYTLDIDTNYSYFFELVSPYNKVVVTYEKPQIIFLGARNLLTQEEVAPETIADVTGWNVVPSYNFNDMEELVAASCSLDPNKQEGFIVTDHGFNRVKIKCPEYVRLHRFISGFNYKTLVDMVSLGEGEEIRVSFPHLIPTLDKVEEAYVSLIEAVERDYESIKNEETQKDFAMKALKTPYPDALFAVRNGKSESIRDYYANATAEKVMDTLTKHGLKPIEL